MYFLVFLTGGIAYNILEYFWRGYSHWTMFLDGGICLLGIFLICTKTEINFFYKVLAGALLITGVELISGIIINKVMKLNVWDYSNMPYNILGQICPRYTILWVALCVPVVTVIEVLFKSNS